MSDRIPVSKDCFKARKGLCVDGDSYLDGDVTVTGVLNITELSVCPLSTCKIYSSNYEIIPDELPGTGFTTIYLPLSVADPTIFEQDITVMTDTHVMSSMFVSGGSYLSNVDVTGSATVSGNLTVQDDVHFKGDLVVDGSVTFNANNAEGDNIIFLGDEHTDNVVFNADVDSNITPDNDITYTLGTSAKRWEAVYWDGGSSISSNSVYTSVSAFSANWQSTYDYVNEGGAVNTSLTANSVYSTVSANSANWESTHSWVSSESATNNTDYNQTNFVNVTGDQMTGDLEILGDLYVSGNITFSADDAGTIYLGNSSTDVVSINATLSGDLIPVTDDAHTIGTSTDTWSELHVQDVTAYGYLTAGGMTYPKTDGADGTVMVTDGAGNLSFGQPEKLYLDIRNEEPDGLVAGTPVYAVGEVGSSGVIRVGRADASDPAKMPAIGLVVDTITSGTDGRAVINGVYNKNLAINNTSPGDTLYVASSGGITNIKPIGASNLVQNIGQVLRSNQTNIHGIKVSSIDRSNDIPNLLSGHVFYGHGDHYVQTSLVSAIGLEPDIAVQNLTATQVSWDGGSSTQSNSVYTTTQTYSSDWTNKSTQTFTRGALQLTTPIGDTDQTTPWEPTDVQMEAWWDMNDQTTIEYNSGSTTAVSAVHDRTGNGYTLTQTATSDQPTTTTINNSGALLFDGINDVMLTSVSASPLGTPGESTQDVMIMIAYRVDSVDQQSTLFDNGPGNRFLAHAPWSNGVCYFDVGGTAPGQRLSKSNWATPGQVMVASFYVSLTENVQQIWQNGVMVASDNTGNTATVGNSFNLGGIPGGGADQKCTIGEVIVLNNTVNDTTRQLLEGYLAHKWGVDDELANDHPFKTQQPAVPVQGPIPEFLSMQSDNQAGDATYDDISYDHAMVLPYDAVVKRVVLRTTSSQGATVNLGVHTNRDVIDVNSIAYKFFAQTPIETTQHYFFTNNESKIFNFTSGASAKAGDTLGLSVSADRELNHTNASIVLEFDMK